LPHRHRFHQPHNQPFTTNYSIAADTSTSPRNYPTTNTNPHTNQLHHPTSNMSSEGEQSVKLVSSDGVEIVTGMRFHFYPLLRRASY
jgi:hypothetical protein